MELVKKIQWRLNQYRNNLFLKFVNIENRKVEAKKSIKLNFKHYNIEGKVPYWYNFKSIDFEDVKPIKIENGYVISKGIVVNQAGTLQLESTIFQFEYLNLLKANHLVSLRKLYKKESLEQLVIPIAFYLDWNYYHWLMEATIRLAPLDKETLKKAKIVLNTPILDFQIKSLKFLFDITEKQIHCQHKKVLKASQILLLPFQHIRNQQTQQTNLYNPFAIKQINAISLKKISKTKTAKRFIISRENATERRISNIQLLTNTFPDFEVIKLEEKSFEEQVYLFRKAEIIIATHGAGLTNLLWATPKLKLIELFPNERLIRDAFYFFQISSTLKVKHSVFLYDSHNKSQDCYINAKLMAKIENVISE